VFFLGCAGCFVLAFCRALPAAGSAPPTSFGADPGGLVAAESAPASFGADPGSLVGLALAGLELVGLELFGLALAGAGSVTSFAPVGLGLGELFPLLEGLLDLPFFFRFVLLPPSRSDDCCDDGADSGVLSSSSFGPSIAPSATASSSFNSGLGLRERGLLLRSRGLKPGVDHRCSFSSVHSRGLLKGESQLRPIVHDMR